MKLIHAHTLNPVTSKDVQALIRQLRMALTNHRIYEEGHAQRLSVHRGIWDFLLELSDDIGIVLVEVVPWGLLINGKGLEAEDKGARIVTTWFQERSVDNFLFDGSGRLEDFCVQLDTMASLDSEKLATLQGGGAIAALSGPPLFFNVDVDNSAPADDEVATAQGQSPRGPHTGSGPHTTDSAGSEADDSGSPSGSGGWSDRLSHLNPSGSDAEGADEQGEEDVAAAPSADEQEAAALRALLEEGAEAVVAALSVPLSTEQHEARRRRALLGALQEQGAATLCAQVLGRLTIALTPEVAIDLGVSLLQGCEELVPASIDAGSLHTVAAFVEQIGCLRGSPPRLAGRAEAAQAYMSSPELIEKMVHQMELLPRDQCELIRRILRGFGHSAMPQLFALMMAQDKKSVRLSLAEVMNHHLREAHTDVDLDELTAPLLRELGRASNPWYVKRNLVSILSSVQTPQCQRALQRLADQDQDPRVLTEVARSLMRNDSEGARSILVKLAEDPRFCDAAGLFEVVRSLYRTGDQQVLAGLEQRLAGKDVAATVAEGCLLGLAWVAETASLPFFRRLLTEQKGGLIKRPRWADPVRSAAIEAIATIRGQEAREVLQLGREDKVSEIRRRTVEFTHMEPSRASVAAYRRIGVSPDETER